MAVVVVQRLQQFQQRRDLAVADLRSCFGLVSQDVFLFHGTVRENLVYGRPDATDEEVRRAAELAEALDFVEALPQGFDTVVGERGQKLANELETALRTPRAHRVSLVLLWSPEDAEFQEILNATPQSLRALGLYGQSEIDLERIRFAIKQVVAEQGIEARIKGRRKQPYSIWRKLEKKSITPILKIFQK